MLYCYTRRTLSRLFDRDKFAMVSYRPSAKWISLDHGLSLLEYEARKTPLRGVLRAVRRSSIGSIDVPYCLGNFTVAIFRAILVARPKASRSPLPRRGVR